jgi:hypothetical protein
MEKGNRNKTDFACIKWICKCTCGANDMHSSPALLRRAAQMQTRVCSYSVRPVGGVAVTSRILKRDRERKDGKKRSLVVRKTATLAGPESSHTVPTPFQQMQFRQEVKRWEVNGM